MRTTHRLAAAALVAATLPALAIAAPSQAKGGEDDVRRSGSCSSGAHWKIKAKPDDGRIEVEAEIDSNRAGQSWHWTLKHDGSASARGTSRTAGRSGSFSVERKTVNTAGKDAFVFRATHGGEVCVAKVAI